LKLVLKEIVTRKVTFIPEIGFSHRDKFACITRGACRYLFMRKDYTTSQALGLGAAPGED
ncbi:MAG TPA: hypothetical protein VGF61_07800, partial [Candidatus Acidoferrum sp.]